MIIIINRGRKRIKMTVLILNLKLASTNASRLCSPDWEKACWRERWDYRQSLVRLWTAESARESGGERDELWKSSSREASPPRCYRQWLLLCWSKRPSCCYSEGRTGAQTGPQTAAGKWFIIKIKRLHKTHTYILQEYTHRDIT